MLSLERSLEWFQEKDLKKVSEFFESWGMPDAEAASRSTFLKADTDKSRTIDFEEFKDGLKEMIHSVYIKGEYDPGQDAPLIITPKLQRREKPKLSNQIQP